MSFLFFPAASSACDSPLSRRNNFHELILMLCNRIDYCNSVLYACQPVPTRSSPIHPERSGEDHLENTEILQYLGQHSRRASLAPSSLPARVLNLSLRSELPGRHCPGLTPGTRRRSFLKRRPSEPSIGESMKPGCPKSGYNSIWAARLLCFWAGHLEFPTTGGSTNHEQCLTVQGKVENILHAK